VNAETNLPARVKSFLPPRPALLGMAIGAAYGLLARFAFGPRSGGSSGTAFMVMSLAFLAVVPAVIGAITTSTAERPSLAYRVFAPWVPVLLMVAIAVLIGWEGSICVVMGLPLILLGATAGGLLGAASAARRTGVRPALLFAPFLLAPVEQRLVPAPVRLARTVTQTVIDAPPAAVWPLIASVDSIRDDELAPALFTSIGFPRPVSATLSREGVGGIRRARFEHGLVFTETVIDWQPAHRLRFTISADSAELPASTLDEHVRIGGPYFDVLTGTYELYPLDGGRATRLVLWSEHRTSTRFNPYAGWWVERIMSSIQNTILAVHKSRAERTTRIAGAG
jgi:hypothetical protein